MLPAINKNRRARRKLCEQIGEKEQNFPALVAVAHYHAMRAEHKTARELSE